MNPLYTRALLIIFVCAACTLLERALPFLIFRKGEVPGWVRYLGRLLPPAVIASLVFYCLRNTGFSSCGEFLPPLIAVFVTAGLHLWRKNTFLSVVGGTACYMLLLRILG